jgi:uncharacterized membrane protein
MKSIFVNSFLTLACSIASTEAFSVVQHTSTIAPSKLHTSNTLPTSTTPRAETRLFTSSESNNNNEEEEIAVIERSVSADENCWKPSVRQVLTVLSGIGMAETGYLSYLKIFDPKGIGKICGGEGTSVISSCSSVLNSPYATIQINDETAIPLTLVGFLAYSTVAILSAVPLLSQNTDGQDKREEELDANNRIALLCTTTSMATFSSFLLSLLFNTLHQSCPYCILSATISLTMGFTAWFTGMLPTNNVTNRKNGANLALGSFFTTTLASLFLFFGADEAAISAYQNDVLASTGLSNNVVATAAQEPRKNVPAPPVTSTSSEQSLKIGEDLKELNTRFFGAYWCSHCYEQKQRLGKEAMSNVQYIECSKEGLNSQAPLCKERDVPGYPTWEIGGKLYPGEMYLDELEEIIAKAKQSI